MTIKNRDIDDFVVNRFWHNYLSTLDENGVPVGSRAWYREHVEMYMASNEYDRLATHNPQMISRYLIEKGRNQNLKEWQFRQISDALRLLFCGLIQLLGCVKMMVHD